MLKLFPHNERAYRAAEAMLQETGKAAIIHPTGTGKSFIAFRLCEAHPDKTVCWLSPSSYIFQTQRENLAATGAAVPENIRFFTYARLMNQTDPELLEIAPDYIILDEFHRCGAQMWGEGVQRLLSHFPAVPVLGLSATNIRYLDERRDMALELFDGNIASELTLGEAIVQGILRSPRYVLSVYAYQKDLAVYERRARRAKSAAVRERAKEQIETLRRALERAEGLGEVFARHMEERCGKYLVFCANVEHMQRMMDKAPEWFAQVDPSPHVYAAYADDPESSEAFARFKADDSRHLKLLFCIDMLNEGVHVEDISGVILLRPTVSPIIYKQQIGRALAANQGTDAVIFDIVMNIENLYSIGAVEEEMAIAMTYYRRHGREDLIRQTRFRIIDEVQDCRKLFAALQDTLTASWDMMYQKARAYHRVHGDLMVPKGHRTAEGYPLGQWLQTQRRVRAGTVYGSLSPERIARLDAIGMVWDSRRDIAWERHYRAARDYYETHGDLKVPASYKTQEGVALGAWISHLRTYRKNDLQRQYLTQERIAALDAVGMIWEVADHLWQQYHEACRAYAREHGDLNVPLSYATQEGVRLGAWLQQVRSSRRGQKGLCKLSPQQIQALNDLGMTWEKKSAVQWERGYRAAVAYHQAHGDLNVPVAYQTPEGLRLGQWICRQRAQQETLSEGQRARLEQLGMVWKKDDPWQVRLALAKEYYREHGDLDIPGNYVVEGIWLGKWINEQKQIYWGRRPGKSLTKRQIQDLEGIGMCWFSRKDRAWLEQYDQAKRFFETHGTLSVPGNYVAANGKRLDAWVAKQRTDKGKGKLSQEQVRQLARIGL